MKDPEWQQRSNRAIAVQCGVSPPLVGEVRATLVAEGKIPAQTTRIDRRGAMVHTENIGRKGKESETTGKLSSPIEPNQDDLSQEVSVNTYHLGLDRDRFATMAISLPVCSTSQLWELSEIINTLLGLQSA